MLLKLIKLVHAVRGQKSFQQHANHQSKHYSNSKFVKTSLSTTGGSTKTFSNRTVNYTVWN